MADSPVPSPVDPPLAVHVCWASNIRGAPIAERLFHFLSHAPPAEGGPTLEAGAGVPVFAGYHYDAVAAALDRNTASDRTKIAVVTIGDPPTDRLTEAIRRACAAPGYGEFRLCLRVSPESGAQVDDLGSGERGAEGSLELQVGQRVCALLLGRPLGHPPLTVYVPEPPGKRALAHLPTASPFPLLATTPDSPLESFDLLRKPALCLAIRGEGFSDSPWVQSEVLAAKKRQIPILELLLAPSGELRTFPYGGNVRTVDRVEVLVEACLQAWLRHLFFCFQGPAMAERRELPEEVGPPTYLSRAPELVDLAQGPLSLGKVHVVVYPDPPLPAAEGALLRRANPRARYVTPTTFAGHVLQRDPGPPLAGVEIALSLSHSPELPATFGEIGDTFVASREDGTVRAHLNAAIAYLSMSLLRLGARLAYGGHFRADGYTALLDQLVQAHYRDRVRDEEALVTYIAPHNHDKTSPIRAKRVDTAGIGRKAEKDAERAVELALMRQTMADKTDARVILGGKAFPARFRGDEAGYTGRIPGQAEEALYHLRHQKPLYVSGGFRGAAGLVASALAGGPLPLPREADFMENEHYRAFKAEWDATVSHVPGQPRSLDELWEAIRSEASAFWTVDADGRCPNGLTPDENRRLFWSVHYDEIAVLVVRGMLRVAERNAAAPDAKLRVLAFNGPLCDALDVEAYGVLTLPRRRLSRGEMLLDARMRGALVRRLQSKAPTRILGIGHEAERLAGSWVIPAEVGDGPDPAALVVEGTKLVCERASTHRIGSVAVGVFGLRLGLTPAEAIQAQIRAFQTQRHQKPDTIVICEEDPEVYGEVVAELRKFANDIVLIELEERMAPPPIEQVPVTVQIEERSGALLQFARGVGVRAGIPRAEIPIAAWHMLAARVNPANGQPPDFQEHKAIGVALAAAVLAPSVQKTLAEQPPRRVVDFIVDGACAEVPLELLAWGEEPLALTRVVRRALLVEGMSAPAPRARREKLKMLLIANPTGDLPATQVEAARIGEMVGDFLDVKFLSGRMQASYAAVREQLRQNAYDVVHFAGHGVSHPTDPQRCGLVLEDRIDGTGTRQILTTSDLGTMADSPPLLVFFNACYGAQVTAGPVDLTRPAPLARGVLASGVHAFVGNRWKVDDGAAKSFAIEVYKRWMLDECTLGEALRLARKLLHGQHSPDWANFQLYGADDLRLVG